MVAVFQNIPGWLIPSGIGILSVITLTIILERGYVLFIQIGRERKTGRGKLEKLIDSGEWNELSNKKTELYSILNQGPLSLLHAGILTDKNYLEDLSDESLMRLSAHLRQRLPMLGTVSTIAPLLGLLGTVTGMIKSFHAFAAEGVQNSQLTGGIDEALVTTALGLMVGIPALIFYNLFASHINSILENTEILNKKLISKITHRGLTQSQPQTEDSI